MKVYITKYALTQGIFEKEAEDRGDEVIKTVDEWPALFHGEGKEWHRTKESAVKRAEEMKIKKIQSLGKQIEKLKNLKFE